MSKLTHINEKGDAQMIDVSDKNNTAREAKAVFNVSEFSLIDPATFRIPLATPMVSSKAFTCSVFPATPIPASFISFK